MMKRYLIGTLCLLLLLSCAACGGAPVPEAEEGGYMEALYSVVDEGLAAPGEFYQNASAPREMAGSEVSYDLDGEMDRYESGSTGGGVYDRADAKLIRRAALTIETLTFEEAAATLDAMVQSYDGYYERSDVWGGAYEGATRSGSYTVRIPRQAYDSFMNAVGDVGQMTRRTETSEDVGEDYQDAELHLKTLTIKHERLLSLLEKATDMESIVALQGYLSDVEYQVEYYAGTLRRYDSLIGYATIEIALEERVRLSGDPGEKAGFGTQFGAALSNGLSNAAAAVKHLLLWTAYHFVGLLFFAAAVIVLVLLLRRGLRSRPFTIPPRFKPPFSPVRGKAETSRNAEDTQEEE